MSLTSPFAQPPMLPTDLKRVAMLFAGGPAPAANAVISTAAASFLKGGIEVVGIQYGYSTLEQYSLQRPLKSPEDYVMVTQRLLRRSRNTQGVLLGTARTNPGRWVNHIHDLDDAEKVAPLRAVYEGLCSLEVDALVSIGGDDTLKTANKLKMFQDRLPPQAKRIPVVHLPKTIDNDYMGIDFTFGYFTAVDQLASEIRNLLADAEANRSYFLCETMGRSAGWLAYGAAIAGEASLAISVEDIIGNYRTTEQFEDPDDGTVRTREIMDLGRVVDRIVKTVQTRKERDGKQFGVIVLAEGLAELLPWEFIRDVGRDEHGHLSISRVNLGKVLAGKVAQRHREATGKPLKITAVQLGYEVRCARPSAFDVMLGGQLGVGAYRALVEHRHNGVMVSVSGQLDLQYVPFENLVHPETLVTMVRYVDPNSDFHKLVRFLETDVND